MGNWWARCIRRLGFDRNPLRRPADRIESVLRLVILLLVILGVPAAAVATGRTVDHLALRQAQAQRSEDHLVRAVLTEKAVADTSAHPYSNVSMVWVPAYWNAPGGSVHRGQVLAPVGARPGSAVAVWTDRSGTITDPPKSHAQICIDVLIAVMCAAELLPIALIGVQCLGCHVLNARRMRTWDREWDVIGPQWSGHRT
jgi:hypothetical protein